MELRNRPFALFSSILFLVAVTAFLLFPIYNHHDGSVHYKSSSRLNKGFKAPRRNVWAELTAQEAGDVNDFVLKELSHLNLTKHPRDLRDNFVFVVETLLPNKSDTVLYLYEDGNSSPPERWAKVAVAQNFKDDGPYMVYYMAGPLPIAEDSIVKPLGYVFNSGRNYVRNLVQDYVAIQDFALSMAENVSDITEELLGATASRENPDDPHGLLAFPRGSRVETGGLTMWMQFYRPGLDSGARTLLPQGIYAKVDARSPDIGQWTVGEYYYNGLVYNDAEAFRAALDEPGFKRTVRKPISETIVVVRALADSQTATQFGWIVD
jgi:primary-amine oxidase